MTYAESRQKINTDILSEFDNRFSTSVTNNVSQDCTQSVNQCNIIGNAVIAGNNNTVSQENQAIVKMSCLLKSMTTTDIQKEIGNALAESINSQLSSDIKAQIAQKAQNVGFGVGSNSQSNKLTTKQLQDINQVIKTNVSTEVNTQFTDSVVQNSLQEFDQCNKVKNLIIAGNGNSFLQKNKVQSTMASEVMKTTLFSVLDKLENKLEVKASAEAAAKQDLKVTQEALNQGLGCMSSGGGSSSVVLIIFIILMGIMMIPKGGDGKTKSGPVGMAVALIPLVICLFCISSCSSNCFGFRDYWSNMLKK